MSYSIRLDTCQPAELDKRETDLTGPISEPLLEKSEKLSSVTQN